MAMNFTITTDLILELAESPAMSPEIRLTSIGWDVVANPSGEEDRFPLAADFEIFPVNDLDPDGLTEDDAAALIECFSDTSVRDEYGQILTEETDDQDYYIVIPGPDDEPQPEQWTACWAFDRLKATLAIHPDEAEVRDGRDANTLYRTEGGRWVMHTKTRMNGVASYYTEMSDAEVAELGYTVDPDRVADDAPNLVRASQLARELVTLMSSSAGDLDEAADEAFEIKTVMDLLREDVASDLRQQRARAARTVIIECNGSFADAAQRLGIGTQTLRDLVN